MRFRKGYNKEFDLTEDEYFERWMYDSDDLYADTPPDAFEVPGIEGEPWEDTYLPGIPDYDRFNRPSWGGDEE